MRGFTLRAIGAFLLLCAWLAVGHATPAAPQQPANPPVISLGGEWGIPLYGRSLYWIDDHAAQGVEQVEAGNKPWRLRDRNQQDRLQGSALWIQFDATQPPGERWYLEVGSAVYGKVQLHYRDRTGAWVVQGSGTSLPVSDWTVAGRVPTFALSPETGRPVRYWLRVEDDRADFSAPLALYRSDRLQEKREREEFLYGAYFGLAALVTMASVVNGLAFRDRSFLAFALYIFLLGAGQLGRAGVGAQHLWRDLAVWNSAALALWPGAAAAAALWFAKVVTEPARLSRALDLSVWALILAVLASVAVDIAIGTPMSRGLVLGLTALSLLAVLSMVMWGWIDGADPHLRWVALGLLPVLFIALFPLARGFGLMPTNVLTRSGLFFAVVLQLPIIYYALHLRLIARREGQLRAAALSRSDALTGLPHRQALVERLDSSLAHARGQKQQCALLGVRISNLDAIVEEFGRDASDKALVVAASHLRRTIVDFDMAARVGEREFAVLLEAPVTPELAISRAQQVVANGLKQVAALPAALTLKFHVTVAMLPLPQLDGAGSLEWTLEGLDQITPDARKLIKTLNF